MEWLLIGGAYLKVWVEASGELGQLRGYNLPSLTKMRREDVKKM